LVLAAQSGLGQEPLLAQAQSAATDLRAVAVALVAQSERVPGRFAVRPTWIQPAGKCKQK